MGDHGGPVLPGFYRSSINGLPHRGVALFQDSPDKQIEFCEALRSQLEEYGHGEVRFDNIDVSKVQWPSLDFVSLMDILKEKSVCTERFKAYKCGLDDDALVAVGDWLEQVDSDKLPSELHFSNNNFTEGSLKSLMYVIEAKRAELSRHIPPIWLRVENCPVHNSSDIIQKMAAEGRVCLVSKIRDPVRLQSRAAVAMPAMGNMAPQQDARKDSWDKPRDSWDKPKDSWDKPKESWDKKVDDNKWAKKETSWDKPKDPWDRPKESWDKKEDDKRWDKKPDDNKWERKEEKWGEKKDDGWNRQQAPAQPQRSSLAMVARPKAAVVAANMRAAAAANSRATGFGQERGYRRTSDPAMDDDDINLLEAMNQQASHATPGRGARHRSRTPPRKQAASPRSNSPLPYPWEEQHSEEYGIPYYWNPETGDSSWERPTA